MRRLVQGLLKLMLAMMTHPLARVGAVTPVWTPIGEYTPDEELLFAPGAVNTLGNCFVIDDREGDTEKLWLFFDVDNADGVRASADSVDGPWSAYESVGTYRTFSFYPTQVGGKWYAVASRNSSTKVCLVRFDTLDGSPTEISEIANANADSNGPFVVGSALGRESDTWIALWATAPNVSPYPALMRRATSADGLTWSAAVDTTLISDFATAGFSDVKWVRWMTWQPVPNGYGLWFGAGTFEPPGVDQDRDAKVYYGESATLNATLVPSVKILDFEDFEPPSPIIDNCYAPFGFRDPVTLRQFLFINTGVYGDEGILRLELL